MGAFTIHLFFHTYLNCKEKNVCKLEWVVRSGKVARMLPMSAIAGCEGSNLAPIPENELDHFEPAQYNLNNPTDTTIFLD